LLSTFLDRFLHFHQHSPARSLHSFPTRRSSDLALSRCTIPIGRPAAIDLDLLYKMFDTVNRLVIRSAGDRLVDRRGARRACRQRSEEHTSELQSHLNLVCRLLLEKKNKPTI